MTLTRSTFSLAAALAVAASVPGCMIDRGALPGGDAGLDAPRVDDAALDTAEPDSGPIDVGRRDGGPRDAGPDGLDAPCMATAETCNERDDDCDGTADEDFDLDTDLANCGICGRTCAAADHAGPACGSGTCGLTCDAGFLDCDGDVGNGCEASESSAGSCGDCATRCSGGTPVCEDDGAGGFRCVTGCTAPDMLCTGSCVDVSTSVSHCGGCDMPCAPRAGAVESCSSRSCFYTCRDGVDDCNGLPGDGCERSIRTLGDCGGCGIGCSFPGATASCATGTCTLVSCVAGFDDCDMVRANGCERAIDTLTDCGACGRGCSFPRAAASCTASTCTLGVCDMGYDNCDGMAANGCEADLTARTSCGSCTRVCSGTELCSAGMCVRPTAVVEVATGLAFSCARLRDGRVFCWGADNAGQLGNGAAGASSSATPVVGITDAIDLAAGDTHACVVHAGGAVSCWGQNSKDQLGVAPRGTRDAPAMVMGVMDARAVSAGSEHTCILRASGVVACWGRDNVSQLGDGTQGGDRPMAVDVVMLAGVQSLDAGGNHTCAVLAGGEVYCWGENDARELGDTTATARSTPVRAGTLADATQVSAGANFTCAVRSGGTIECWGANDHGQLGDGAVAAARGTLAPVMMVSDAAEVSCGGDHTCARSISGAVRCWGFNASGRLGDGTMMEQTTPVLVPGLSAVSLAAGGEHTCAALTTGGTASCWGENGSGQLGDGMTGDRPMPTPVTGLP